VAWDPMYPAPPVTSTCVTPGSCRRNCKEQRAGAVGAQKRVRTDTWTQGSHRGTKDEAHGDEEEQRVGTRLEQ